MGNPKPVLLCQLTGTGKGREMKPTLKIIPQPFQYLFHFFTFFKEGKLV